MNEHQTAAAEPADGTVRKVCVNGDVVETRAATLAALIEAMGYRGLQVATAVNGDFVAARNREMTAIGSGDTVEIVAPRQGG